MRNGSRRPAPNASAQQLGRWFWLCLIGGIAAFLIPPVPGSVSLILWLAAVVIGIVWIVQRMQR